MTNANFDLQNLSNYYPRGAKELRGPFSKFSAPDTVKWFAAKGVQLKTEADGRMFPISDDSKTITDCFESQRKEHGIELFRNAKVKTIQKQENVFICEYGKEKLKAENVLLATGGAKQG